MTGTTIGRYELLDKLGEGGMGVVYRARDVLLNRSAAIKLLSADGPQDEERKRRFLQEAQAASALNHPNIVTIYDASLAEPQDFIAMEYVQGRTLDTILGPSGLPLRDVLSYAVQIADALACAHSAGIVHRDVKPGNIMVSDTGQVKMLDFGLAKLNDPISRMPSEDGRTIPMRAAPKTVEGTIVGTVSYMSPEQAEGKRVDHRSDIWAFGAVLYEMLTGRKAFAGDSTVSTLAAILHTEPEDISRSVQGVPRELNRILRRCLEKSPERRWQSMADVHVALEDLRQDMQSGVLAQPAIPAPPASRHRLRWAAIAAVPLLAATIAGVMLWRRAPQPSERYNIRLLTFDVAANVSPAISPDGKLIAYASDRSGGNVNIWVQQVAGGEPIRLATGGLCHDPSFSPDGSQIMFRGGPDGIGIFVVSALGGTPRNVAYGWWPQWSPDGTQISYINPANSRIMVKPAGGGTAREVATKRSISGRVLWLPDGKALLFLGLGERAQNSETDWYTVPVEGGEESAAGAAARFRLAGMEVVRPHSVSAKGVLIAADTNIYRVPFDFGGRRVTGPPVPITIAPNVNFWPSASADGEKIAFGSATRFNTNLWRLSLDPATGVATGEPHRVTEGLQERLAPFPSPDGKLLVYNSVYGSMVEIRLRNLETGEETRIGESSAASPPVISDDGTQIAYAVIEQDRLSIYAAPVRGGLPRRLCTDCGRPIQWFANATKLLCDRSGDERRGIGVLDVSTGKMKPLLRHSRHRLFTPRVSPDGRVLVFTAVAGPLERRFYLVPFTPDREIEEREWKTLMDGADQRQPFWSPNGEMLYFLSERDGYRCVWARRFHRETLQVVGEPLAVRHFHAFSHSLLDFDDVANIGLSVSRSHMYLAARELQSNIWLAEAMRKAQRRQP